MKNFIIALMALCPCLMYGQSSVSSELDQDMNTKPVKNLEVTFGLGLSSYEGDLHCFEDDELNTFSNAGLSLSVGIKKQMGNQLTVGLNYSYISLSGDDNDFAEESHQRRGYNFENNISELALLAEYYPFGNKGWKLQPYIYGGPALALGKANTNFGNNTDDPNQTAINTDMAEIKKLSFALPIGLGVQYGINEKLSISAQASLRFLANDYIDGVSVAANSDINDYYGDGVLKLGYRF